MRLGLTVKLSILLACFGILASGVTGYYSYSANQSLLVGEAERNLLTSTDLLGRRFSAQLDDIAADAETLASMPSAARIASLTADQPGDPATARLAGVFATIMRLHPQYSQVRLISRQEHGLEVLRFDRDGDRLVQVEGAQLQEKGHFPYVFETLELAPGQFYSSPITVNHEQGAHAAEGAASLRIATPVKAADGSVVGVTVINVDLDRFLEAVQAELPNGHQLYLANEWGDILVHPDPAMTFGFDKGRRLLIQDSFDATRALFDGSRRSVQINGLDAPEQARNKIMTFVRSAFGTAANHPFVIIGLSRPLDDVLGSGQSLGQRIVQIVLVFSLLAIALAVLFSQALTRPLQMLIHAARGFQTRHTLEEKLPLERQDEIGVLARGFEQMRRELKSHIEAMNHNQQELRHLANHDSLTGLPNRMQFFQQMEQAIAEVSISHEQLAVLFIDLDHFKKINDEMGHAVGDEVLRIVACRLRGSVRSEDLVARLGGDEFVVLIRGAGIAAVATSITRKILAALNQQVMVEDVALLLGASIGISQYPEDGRSAEELLLRADGAMYRAKVNGRRTFVRHQDLPAPVVERTAPAGDDEPPASFPDAAPSPSEG